MTSSIMHSCDESDDSLRITSVEVEVEVEKETHNVVYLLKKKYSVYFKLFFTAMLCYIELTCHTRTSNRILNKD